MRSQKNKTKLTKVYKLKERKLKEKEMLIIKQALAQNHLTPKQMEQMKSIKHQTCDTTVNKLKQIRVKKVIIEQIMEEIEAPIVQSKPENPQSLKVNIFNTGIFEQKLEQQAPVQQTIIKRDAQQERLDLENQTKKLIPQLSLQTFEAKRNPYQRKFQQKDINIYDDDIYDIDPLLMIHEDKEIKRFELKPHEIIRTKEQEIVRKQLPIYFKESEIIDAIQLNLVTVISGETGSGKSTQLPQFLVEAGFAHQGIIGVTQPRRLPTITLAKRVAAETNFTIGEEITYQVRHEVSGFSQKQKIKFMTDGILVNEMVTSALLPQYSVIIIDEAHERKVNTDILIAVLSRIVLVRSKMNIPPLRLVIMSATIKLDDFTQNKQVFPRGVNVIQIESRQFPVTIYYNKRTKEDYIEEAITKCIKIHEKLPAGDILIFLTGQKEIINCCKLLEERLYRRHDNKRYGDQFNDQSEQEQQQDEDIESGFQIEDEQDEGKQNDDDSLEYNKKDYLELREISGKRKKILQTKNPQEEITDFIVYPLYSKLDFHEQEKVFKNHEWQKKRMIVVATNVAETSVTIPTIRYVIDAGKFKKKVTQASIGLQKHFVEWVSQAAADQRSGRAGRTGPGYCYRLYTTAVYSNIFQKYNSVEILETPLQQVMLNLKNIGVKNIYHLPFLSMPDKNHIKEALSQLKDLKAIEDKVDMKSEDSSQITSLGKVLAAIPLVPKYAKMLLQARSDKILNYGLLLVCVYSVDEIIRRDSFKVETQQLQTNPLGQDSGDEDDVLQFKKQINDIEAESRAYKQALKGQRQQFRDIREFLQKYSPKGCHSDLIALINIIGDFMIHAIKLKNRTKNSQVIDFDKFVLKYSQENNLLFNALMEIYNNMMQIVDILKTILTDQNEFKQLEDFLTSYQQPNNEEVKKLINLIIQSSQLNQICHLQQTYNPDKQTYTKYYQSMQTEVHQFIHPSSLLCGQVPEFIIYTHMLEVGTVSTKSYLFNVTSIEDLAMIYALDKRSDDMKKLRFESNDKVWYDEKEDKIIGMANAVIGTGWDLQNFKLPIKTEDFSYFAVFARLLLRGDIFKFFKSTQKLYKYQIDQIKETNMQLYSQAIINSLRINEITSKRKLIIKWREYKNYFLEEFLQFTQEKYHNNIKQKWPPLN